LFFVLINRDSNDRRSKVFVGVLLVNLLLLASFLIRQLFENQPNPAYNTVLIWTSSVYQAVSQVLLLLHIKITLLSIENKTEISKLTKITASAAVLTIEINFVLSA